jgi:hypothetical protein
VALHAYGVKWRVALVATEIRSFAINCPNKNMVRLPSTGSGQEKRRPTCAAVSKENNNKIKCEKGGLMPYIPAENRPAIDEAVAILAEEIAAELLSNDITAALSERYRICFMAIAEAIVSLEKGMTPTASLSVDRLAARIIEAARGYRQQGGWLGELNYALTRLIQQVPFIMHRNQAWKEAMRYWLYAETVGALTRTAYDIHSRYGNDWISNGLAGVFEDVKDEYKRRVNTAYEAAQIRKSGDCYDHSPFRTELVKFNTGGADGWIEIMLPQQKLQHD